MFHTLAFYGIAGLQAPEWNVDTWTNLPAGKSRLTLADFQGKVVFLLNFQSWCTGCHQYGFPTLLSIIDEFRDDPNVAFVAIQTTFEGYDVNTAEKLNEIIREYSLDIPVGHAPIIENGRPQMMKDYRSGGTPWAVIIDTEGVVRFNDFYIDAPQAIRLIRYLVSRKKPADVG